MTRRLRILVAVLALLTTGFTTAQALDFEVRYEVGLLGASPGFGGAARLNLPIGPSILGARVWVLPEIGGMITSPLEGYARVQILADAEALTLFADARYTLQPDGATRGTVWVGARFGIDLTGSP